MNTRSTAGSGSIDQLPSGRWRVRLTLADGSRRALGAYEDRDEAERIRSAALAELAEGSLAPVGGVTLRAFGALWLDRRERRKLRNVRTDRNRWKNHIESASFIDWPLVNINRRAVRGWCDDLLAKRAADLHPGERRKPRAISAGTVRHCLNLLRRCLQEAVEDELISVNPARDLRVARPPRTDDAWTYLTRGEQEAVEACASRPEADRLLALFAIGTGLRQGEQWSLELADVHLRAPEPHVVVRYGGRRRAPTKSGKPRTVPLFGIGLRAVSRWLEVLPSYAPSNPLGLLFPLPGGEQRDKKSYGWHLLRKAAGVTRHVRWHDLRHTCASSLVAGWWGRAWRLEEVRDVLGHTSVTQTERYAHLASSALAKAASETHSALNSQGHAKVTPSGPVWANPSLLLGAPQRIRTSDLRLRRPSLYPAELVALRRCARWFRGCSAFSHGCQPWFLRGRELQGMRARSRCAGKRDGSISVTRVCRSGWP
jgi:integrase